ncbi:protein kinase domain-containing protein [Actinomadura rifamycini]|uniref:protein kinase domain-containing protein n=1 Tax=Actinomadura rifamycini TaxID=31962 RepID=UPI003133CC77
MSPAMLHGVAIGVAAALVAIHRAGLVHRDLKPGNVLLSITGPRVIDFGIARALDETDHHTGTGQLIGTPGWIAPEQITGREVTPAADVFAWGCLVAYAATGGNPFGRGSFELLSARVLHAEPTVGNLPDPLGGLVRAALSKEPAHRPAARDLLLALAGGDTDADAATALDARPALRDARPDVPADAEAAPEPPNTALPNTALPNTGLPNTGLPNTVPPTTPPTLPSAGSAATGTTGTTGGHRLPELPPLVPPAFVPPPAAPPAPPEPPRRLGRTLAVAAAVALVAAVSAVGVLEWRSSLPPDDPLLVAVGLDEGCADAIGLHVPGADGPKRLVSEVWCVQNPQWSPDRARIAFTRSDSAGHSAWTMNRDGTGLRKVVDMAGPATSWTPDGAGLTYVGERDGREGVFTAAAATGKIEQVATVRKGDARFHDPAWSSTGLLAFSYREDDGPPRLHIVDPAAPEEWRAVTPDGVDARAPSWSPDGSTIAYTALEPGMRDGGPENRDIWLISAKGSPNRRELDVPGSAVHPTWSPDGRWICYVHDGEDVRAARTNGDDDRSLAPEGDSGTITMPDWS